MSIVFCVGQWKLIGKMARELLECFNWVSRGQV